jgi:hypothetical protein
MPLDMARLSFELQYALLYQNEKTIVIQSKASVLMIGGVYR